ncbi:MAG: Uma2 family endonuclease, partial [Merismopedia sp. SIO2A8]|nr:Uma2 family endonuclease [Merismopedia sp. SIO2A8]
MIPTITPNKIDIPPGGSVILQGQIWDDYETLLATRHPSSSLKLSFSASTQEIRVMSPLPKHAHGSAILVDLVKALLRFHKLDWQDFDPLTLKKLKQKGLEPDHCFYIQHYQAILGRRTIDLAADPPPDLALEVDLTSFSSIDEYESIGIPELWIYRSRTL